MICPCMDMPQLRVEFSGDHRVLIVVQTPELDSKHLSFETDRYLNKNELLQDGMLVPNINPNIPHRDKFSVALNLKETIYA